MNRFFLVLETDGWSEERLRPRRCSRTGSRHSRATTPAARISKIRRWLGVVMLALVVSGVTAFPLQTELAFALRVLHAPWLQPLADRMHLLAWITQVHAALADTNARYAFLAYGTDWLAFAHLVIAVVFIGPWRDPVRNQWVITFGLISCAGVLPLALLAGPLRGLPFGWQLIDCSFGVFGAIPLLFCRHHIRCLEQGR